MKTQALLDRLWAFPSSFGLTPLFQAKICSVPFPLETPFSQQANIKYSPRTPVIFPALPTLSVADAESATVGTPACPESS